MFSRKIFTDTPNFFEDCSLITSLASTLGHNMPEHGKTMLYFYINSVVYTMELSLLSLIRFATVYHGVCYMPYSFFKQNSTRAICALIGYSTGIASTYLLNTIKDQRERKKLFLFEPKKLQVDYDYLAPDASEIRCLQTNKHSKNGDMAHCRLPIQSTSIAVKHRTVEEIWYFSNGKGEMWLKENNGVEHIFKVEKGMALTIPRGASFQFKNTSEIESLEVIITTMPPWPGPEEVVKVQGKWEPSTNHEEKQYKFKKG